MNCPRCNHYLRDNALFCDKCGLSLISYNTPTERAIEPHADASYKDPLIGHVLDSKYKLTARLGEGGMGMVYRAQRLLIGDDVAVKVLLQKYVTEGAALERFRREARAAAMLRHPNVVAIYDFGEARGDDAPAYIVMELVEGESLRSLLRSEGKLTVQRCVALMRDVCAGVGAAHRRNIVHRDLKPDNIIVLPPEDDDERETVKVVDFGIAKLRDLAAGQTLTQTGAVMGTPYYMSPEQCRGDSLDARSDVYSLGAMLYEMLAGVPPFVARTPTGVVAKHLTENPPPLPAHLNIPPSLEAIILRTLAKDPNERQQDAITLSRDLKAAMQVNFVTPLAQTQHAVGVMPKNESTGDLDSTVLPSQSSEIRTTTAEQAAAVSEELRRREEEEEQRRAEIIAAEQKRKEQELLARRAQEEEQIQAEVERLRRKAQEERRREEAEATRLAQAEQLRKESEQRQRREAEEAKEAREAEALARKHTEDERRRRESVNQTIVSKPELSPFQPVQAQPSRSESDSKALIVSGLIALILLGGIAVWVLLPGAQEQPSKNSAAATSQTTRSAAPAPPVGMAYVPGGEFKMGRVDGDEFERPERKVTVTPFFIDLYEVTREDYRKFISATGHQAPSSWTGGVYLSGTERLPVTGISWDDANDYARWAGKRLPTEEEWEFAARGTDGRRYPWGNGWQQGMANAESVSSGMVAVGSFKGASPYGAFDMVGNAWEWTASSLVAYPGGALPKQVVPGDLKVIRGGMYQSNKNQATTTYRRGWPSRGADDYSSTGFRCARDIQK